MIMCAGLRPASDMNLIMRNSPSFNPKLSPDPIGNLCLSSSIQSSSRNRQILSRFHVPMKNGCSRKFTRSRGITSCVQICSVLSASARNPQMAVFWRTSFLTSGATAWYLGFRPISRTRSARGRLGVKCFESHRLAWKSSLISSR
ncbi:hypothetical protein D3C71_1778550 [compost metagenome]